MLRLFSYPKAELLLLLFSSSSFRFPVLYECCDKEFGVVRLSSEFASLDALPRRLVFGLGTGLFFLEDPNWKNRLKKSKKKYIHLRIWIIYKNVFLWNCAGLSWQDVEVYLNFKYAFFRKFLQDLLKFLKRTTLN